MELSLAKRKQLSELYWNNDVSTKELQQYYGLSKPVHLFLGPLPTDESCPNSQE